MPRLRSASARYPRSDEARNGTSCRCYLSVLTELEGELPSGPGTTEIYAAASGATIIGSRPKRRVADWRQGFFTVTLRHRHLVVSFFTSTFGVTVVIVSLRRFDRRHLHGIRFRRRRAASAPRHRHSTSSCSRRAHRPPARALREPFSRLRAPIEYRGSGSNLRANLSFRIVSRCSRPRAPKLVHLPHLAAQDEDQRRVVHPEHRDHDPVRACPHTGFPD